MNPADPLGEFERLLEQLAQAVRDGRAEDIPCVVQQLQRRIGELGHARGRPVPAALHQRLAAIQARLTATQSVLARRQQSLDRSLQALGAAHPGLRAVQSTRLYGAAGQLVGFGR